MTNLKSRPENVFNWTKACQGCGIREGELDPDGKPVTLEPCEGDLLCAECREVLADAQCWV